MHFNLLEMDTFVIDFQIKFRARNKGALLTRLFKLPAVHPITGTRNKLGQVIEVVVFSALRNGPQGSILVTLWLLGQLYWFAWDCYGCNESLVSQKSLSPRQTVLVGHHTEQPPRVKVP